MRRDQGEMRRNLGEMGRNLGEMRRNLGEMGRNQDKIQPRYATIKKLPSRRISLVLAPGTSRMIQSHML